MAIPYHPDRFVNRKAELQHIMDVINSLSEKTLEPYKHVIHITGQDGIGKSWLLKECHDRLIQDPRTLSIYLTMEKSTKQSTKQSTKEDFLMGLLKEIDGPISSALSIISPFAQETPASLYEYCSWTVGSIQQAQDDRVIVFLIDEINLPSIECMQALEDYLLANLINEPKLVFVFAGRYPVTTWKDFSLRPVQQENIMELEFFDLEKTTQQLHNHKPGSEHLAEKVLVLSDGSPGNNDIILEYATGDPLQINDEFKAVQACNQELRETIQAAAENANLSDEFRFTSDDLLCALDALCVLQDFDKDDEAPILLKAHTQFRDTTRTQINRLIDLISMINIGPGNVIYWDMVTNSYLIEKQIRQNLERELKLRDVELWKALHCTAMQMYQEWADEFDLLVFKSKADYHREQLFLGGFDPTGCVANNQEVNP